MRKAVLMLLLAVSSGNAAAAWVKIGGSASGGFNFYVDPGSIATSGNTVKLWWVSDFTNVQTAGGKRFVSTKTQAEYNCATKQLRSVYFSRHSGSMGGGDTVHFQSVPDNWTAVASGSVDEIMWNLACAKK